MEGQSRVEGASGHRGCWWLLAFSVAILLLPGARCSHSGRDGELEFVPLVCRSPRVKTQMAHVHYPQDDCRSAVRKAEGRLASGHYRRACEQVAPAAGLPAKVVEVRVTACAEASSLDGYEGGSVLWLDVCCP